MTYLAQANMGDHWWWRPGWDVGTRFYAWHILFHDQPAVHRLAGAYQRALAGLPELDIIPSTWLHMTVHGLGHVESVPDDERDAVLAVLRPKLAAMRPPTLTFRRPALFTEAVVLLPDDQGPVLAIRQAFREAIAQVWGAAAVTSPASGYHAHVSVAYAHAPVDAARIASALAPVNAGPAEATITAASLIVLNRDHRMYQWDGEQRIPIGGG